MDKDGTGYVLPVEGKKEGESLGKDKAVALTKFARVNFPKLRCRPIAIVRQAKDVSAWSGLAVADTGKQTRI